MKIAGKIGTATHVNSPPIEMIQKLPAGANAVTIIPVKTNVMVTNNAADFRFQFFFTITNIDPTIIAPCITTDTIAISVTVPLWVTLMKYVISVLNGVRKKFPKNAIMRIAIKPGIFLIIEIPSPKFLNILRIKDIFVYKSFS